MLETSAPVGDLDGTNEKQISQIRSQSNHPRCLARHFIGKHSSIVQQSHNRSAKHKANGEFSAFKIQTHKMFLDTSFNSLTTVLSSIFKNFIEASRKYYRYAKCMTAQPPVSLLISKFALAQCSSGQPVRRRALVVVNQD